MKPPARVKLIRILVLRLKNRGQNAMASPLVDIPFDPWFSLETCLPVELPCDHGALSPVVPVVESVGGEVEMFPRAEDIIERGVEIASAVFVAVVVVIQGGEGG